MIELPLEQIVAATDADLRGGTAKTAPQRAVVDSREVARGDLFFGLPGANSNGGEFAAGAIEAGAWGVVVTPRYAARLEAAPVPVFVTHDPLTALQELAKAWLEELRKAGARVVGITGSTGKTSTKDILLSLLSHTYDGRAHANRQNFNTEIGLPLTVLEAAPGTQALVLEMAMRGMGQIRELGQIARPEVGVITNIGPVHLELVGTIENVAEAKAELIAELPTRATCVVPAAEEALRPHLRSDVKLVTFASWQRPRGDSLAEAARIADASADVRALSRTASGETTVAEVVVNGQRATFEFNFSQPHNLTNALAAIGAAHALGVSLDQLSEGAGRISFSSMRGERLELPDAVLAINDCYNANPTSMRAALDYLAQVRLEREGGRAVAVLGDMKELGQGSALYHREIGSYAADSGVDLLVAVGSEREALVEGFGAGETRQATDAEQAASSIGDLVEPGDTILIKASRGVGLERVTEELARRLGTQREG